MKFVFREKVKEGTEKKNFFEKKKFKCRSMDQDIRQRCQIMYLSDLNMEKVAGKKSFLLLFFFGFNTFCGSFVSYDEFGIWGFWIGYF